MACANVGGLLVSRAPARARDIAMRLAIGAGRAQVVRRLMVEGVLMAVGGAAIAGLGLAYAAIGVFQRLEFPTDFPLKLTFALDLRAFTVGAAAALACALLASLVPAWMASRTDLSRCSRATARRGWLASGAARSSSAGRLPSRSCC